MTDDDNVYLAEITIWYDKADVPTAIAYATELVYARSKYRAEAKVIEHYNRLKSAQDSNIFKFVVNLKNPIK